MSDERRNEVPALDLLICSAIIYVLFYCSTEHILDSSPYILSTVPHILDNSPYILSTVQHIFYLQFYTYSSYCCTVYILYTFHIQYILYTIQYYIYAIYCCTYSSIYIHNSTYILYSSIHNAYSPISVLHIRYFLFNIHIIHLLFIKYFIYEL